MNATALVVDSKTRRFWVLVDKSDGTMLCNSVGSNYDHDKATNYSHDEIQVFTSRHVALRAAADAFLNDCVDVEPIEVSIVAIEVSIVAMAELDTAKKTKHA